MLKTDNILHLIDYINKTEHLKTIDTETHNHNPLHNALDYHYLHIPTNSYKYLLQSPL